MIYLDHCATTPPDPEVLRAKAEALELARTGKLANPSSVHSAGRKARAMVSESRRAVAKAIHAKPEEIVFTSSASEANNLAIQGIAEAHGDSPIKLVVSAIEHECVLNAARALAASDPRVKLIEVAPNEEGVIQSESVERACKGGAALVCVMAVNNETGVIQPVAEIAKIAHRAGGRMLVDAVQAMGRIEVDPGAWDCDLISISAHKIYGPQGVGMLWVKRGTPLKALIHGGHQEGNRRAGTENVSGIVGFARAMTLAAERIAETHTQMKSLETAFLERLVECGAEFVINGAIERKVPGILNLSLDGAQSHDFVAGMDLAGIAISAGAACSSGVIEPSRVIRAMGLPDSRAGSSIRISFGKGNTISEARTAAEALAKLQKRFLDGDNAALEVCEDESEYLSDAAIVSHIATTDIEKLSIETRKLLHDLSQPMAAILGRLQLLELKAGEGDPNAKAIHDLVRQASSANDLMRRIHDLHRAVSTGRE